MLGSLLRRLTGHRPEPDRTTPVPPPAAAPDPREDPSSEAGDPSAEGGEQPATAPDPQGAFAAGPGSGPVFSSRAVRDATVVTGTIEALGRFVAGQDVLDDLTWRLESLTVDQVNFLQLSAEPGLIQRAQARSEVLKGAKAAALRKLLTDLAGGAIPEPVNRTNPLIVPKGPILPPLASLQPRGPTVATDTPAPAASPAADPPPMAAAPSIPIKPVPLPPLPPLRPLPPAPTSAVPEQPALPPIPPVSVALRPLSSQPLAPLSQPPAPTAPAPPPLPPVDKVEAPAEVATAALAPAPTVAPAPPPRQPDPPVETASAATSLSLPRLGRQDAEARRARLLGSLTDSLSASEAAP